jgi:integrase
MASLRKRGRVWYFSFINHDGRPTERKGCSDRTVTLELARAAASGAARVKAGQLDPRELARIAHSSHPLSDHFTEYRASLIAKGTTHKHADLAAQRARRVASVAGIDRLTDLDAERVQGALKALRDEGLSLQTVNHHRTAIRAFSRWCWKGGRTRNDTLAGVTGFNVKEDRRHDRRTIGIDELRGLIEATHSAPPWRKMTGPARALCYRLAVGTGLRYAEIASITPESFDWKGNPVTVTVAAGYTKNGEPATLPLPSDLADDLQAHVATLPPGRPVFPLAPDCGAKMLRPDLARAGIPYVDAGGLVFDFHALRCQCATLADAAGVTPRVVQRLMRHSTLELTGRYTRPRAIDLNRATESLPSLRPDSDRSDASTLAATGTDGQFIRKPFADYLPNGDDRKGRILSGSDVMTGSDEEESMKGLSSKKGGLDASSRLVSGPVASTGEATRTPDLRIMRPPL